MTSIPDPAGDRQHDHDEEVPTTQLRAISEPPTTAIITPLVISGDQRPRIGRAEQHHEQLGNQSADRGCAPIDDINEASAWANNAVLLARWVNQHLVNREDIYGRYLPLDKRTDKRKVFTEKKPLTDEVLRRHFAADNVGQIIGLYALGLDSTARWLAVDIDQHGQFHAAIANRNFSYAVAKYNVLRELGFLPLLFDSNGRGGFHLAVLFSDPLQGKRAQKFGARLIQDWREHFLADRPEVFPRQGRLSNNGGCGNWLRLPGRHHTHDHFTRVWNGTNWAVGTEAIQIILSTIGQPGTLISARARSAATSSSAPAPARHIAATSSSAPAPARQLAATSLSATHLNDAHKPPIERVLDRLSNVRTSGAGWIACCPAHMDRTPSLSINMGHDGRVLLHCFAGCELWAILDRIGLRERDLFASAGICPWPSSTTILINPPARESNRQYWWGDDWELARNHMRGLCGPQQLDHLAAALGLPTSVVSEFDVGWFTDPHGECWTIPEVDGEGKTIGISCRYLDGTKGAITGSHRGLIVPRHWQNRPGTVFCPEGFSDTAALTSQGLAAIGRPSAAGGVSLLADMLKSSDRTIIVVGENDECPDGSWPGRDGAVRAAQNLTQALGRVVKSTLPPNGFKDVREFVVSRGVA